MKSSSVTLESMTSYATTEVTLPGRASGRKIQLHAKSVNHRFFEFRWRVSREWSAYELVAKQILSAQLRRGSVEVWVEEEESTAGSNGVETLFRSLSDALQKSLTVSSLPAEQTLQVLLKRPDAWQTREDRGVDEVSLKAALDELAARLLEARRREGAATGLVLRRHLERLAALRTELLARSGAFLENWQKETKKRLETLAAELQIPAPSQERIAQEFLLLAEKREVSEELNRIEIHLQALGTLLEKPDPKEGAGKRLEFLVQELHREWTTLGNKIHDAAAGQLIIEAKLEIEKIREQSLNLV